MAAERAVKNMVLSECSNQVQKRQTVRYQGDAVGRSSCQARRGAAAGPWSSDEGAFPLLIIAAEPSLLPQPPLRYLDVI